MREQKCPTANSSRCIIAFSLQRDLKSSPLHAIPVLVFAPKFFIVIETGLLKLIHKYLINKNLKISPLILSV